MKIRNKDRGVKFFKPAVPKGITDLNWKQAKARFPELKPYGDVDRDKVKNIFDCKPFDIKRQGEKHKKNYLDEISVGFGDIKKLQTIGDVQKLEESMLKREEDED